jgi:c-opsin
MALGGFYTCIGSAKLGRVQAAVLLTLIWSYALAVTCPPLFGWGRYDREAAHIR